MGGSEWSNSDELFPMDRKGQAYWIFCTKLALWEKGDRLRRPKFTFLTTSISLPALQLNCGSVFISNFRRTNQLNLTEVHEDKYSLIVIKPMPRISISVGACLLCLVSHSWGLSLRCSLTLTDVIWWYHIKAPALISKTSIPKADLLFSY